MSNGSQGDSFNSSGGNMNIAKGRGTAIQINELHLHEQRQESPGKSGPSTPREKMLKEEEHRVFICYAREDLALAQQVYDDLERAGASPWIDEEELLAGQKWQLIIEQTIQSSSYVLVLLSQISVSKRGFVHKEIKQAVSLLDEFPDSAIFVIPVRLEDCQPPRQLEGLQWVDLFPDYQAGLAKLLKVLAPEGRESLLRRKLELITQELARLEQKRGVETDCEQIGRLDTEIREVQMQQEQTETQLEDLDEPSVTSPVIVVPTLPLRSAPQTLSREDVDKLEKHYRGLQNDFEDRGEVIVDRATALTWQQSGSEEWLSYAEAQEYVEALNRQKFADYTDWRLPTIPELLSLVEPEIRSNGLYIDPGFDPRQRWCWSADTVAGSSGSAWNVGFYNGGVDWDGFQHGSYVRCVRS